MKKLPLVLIIALSMAFVPLLAQAPDDARAVAKGSNVFALRVFGELAKGEGNLFFSPYSISSALAMTYAGARGGTATQMAEALAFSLPPERLNPALSGLMAGLNAKGKPYELHVANALWGQTRYPFAPAFLQTIKTHFGGGFREVDFIDDAKREQARLMINAWTEEQTANKIKDLIAQGVLSNLSRLVLTNAIYFKGRWARQFEASATQSMPFTVSGTQKVAVPMMRQTGPFGYARDGGVQILELPYAGGDLSMIVLLPAASSSVEKLREALPQQLDGWLAAISPEEVEVYLPRFKLEQRFLLNEPLIALGMADAFSDTAADFSGMRADGGKDLYISKVIHKAFVDVNEVGTEAAAATAVVMGTKSVQMTPVFKADHPFLFLIRDVRTGTILFMGRLSDAR